MVSAMGGGCSSIIMYISLSGSGGLDASSTVYDWMLQNGSKRL